MPSKGWLIGVFLVSLIVALLVTLPASLLLSRLDGLRLGAAPLKLAAVSGSIWQGQGQWRWQQLGGRVQWDVDWHGLTPGVALSLDGAVQLRGWLGGWGRDDFRLQGVSLALPGGLVTQVQPKLKLEGRINVSGLQLTFSDKAVTDAAGKLAYTGGQARWMRQKEVAVPALHGTITRQQKGPELQVLDDSNTLMALARIDNNVGSLTLYRAWAIELGLSSGGAASDVIFETSLPLWQVKK